jgi:hypothetical protein
MLCGKVNDDPLIRLRQGVEPHDDHICTLPDRAVERRPQVFRLSHVEKLGADPEGSRGRLDLSPRRWD